VNEFGACEATWRVVGGAGEWSMPAAAAADFCMVAESTREHLSPSTAKLSAIGKAPSTLEAAASISTHTGTDIITDLITHAGTRHITHAFGHSALTADMGVAAQRADALGIGFIGALEKNGIKGIIDSMRLIDKYQIKSLQRESGRASSLKQEDIFMKATSGKNMKQTGWTAHRALELWTTLRPSASG